MFQNLFRGMTLIATPFVALTIGINSPCMAQQIVWEAYHRAGDEAYGAKNSKLALQLFGRALDEAQQEDSPTLTAATATRLGEIFYEAGDFKNSEASFRLALDAFDTSHNTDTKRDNTVLGKVDVVHVLHGLASSLQKQDKSKDAEPILRHAIRIVENREPNDDVILLKLMNALAHCLYSQGDQIAALALVKQATLLASSDLGADHHLTAETGLLEAAILSDNADHEVAAKKALESLDKVEKAFGTDHPRATSIRLFVGKMRHLKGDTDGAKKTVMHARDSLKKHYHEDHPIHHHASELHNSIHGVQTSSDANPPATDKKPTASELNPEN